MPRLEPNANDRARLRRLDTVVDEIAELEKKLDQKRSARNKLIWQLAVARIMPMLKLAKRAKVSEPYAYRCMHDKGEPKTGASS